MYDKRQSNGLWFLRYGGRWTEFFVILHPFLHLYPSNNLKNQTFEINAKNSRRYYHLQMCIINDNHIIHGSWDMEHNGYNFLSFWPIFSPFAQLTHSVHPPPFFSAGVRGRVESPTKFSKRRAFTGPQLLEGGCWERGECFFQGGCNFHIKNKSKSEISNYKKSL